MADRRQASRRACHVICRFLRPSDDAATMADTSELARLDLSFLPAWAMRQEKEQRQVCGASSQRLNATHTAAGSWSEARRRCNRTRLTHGFALAQSSGVISLDARLITSAGLHARRSTIVLESFHMAFAERASRLVQAALRGRLGAWVLSRGPRPFVRINSCIARV